MAAETMHIEPPTPEDARWANALRSAESDHRGRTKDDGYRYPRFDRYTVAVFGFAGLVAYALLSTVWMSRGIAVYALALGCMVLYMQWRARHVIARSIGFALAGLICSALYALSMIAAAPAFGPSLLHLIGVALFGPIAGWVMGITFETLFWLAGVVRKRRQKAAQRDAEATAATKSQTSIYSVPRRFDVATLLTVSFAYSLLFTLLKLLDSHWSVSAFFGGVTVVVALGQMLVEGDRDVRNASMLAGMTYMVIWSFAMITLFGFGAAALPALFISFILGPLLGYCVGVVDAGVFLVADLFRKRLEGKHG